MGPGVFIGWGIFFFGTDQLNIHRGKLFPASQTLEQIFFDDHRFLLNVKPGKDEGHAITVTVHNIEADFGSIGWWFAADARYTNPIRAGLGNLNRIEPGDDIRGMIAWPPDFIKKLGRHRADGNNSSRLRVLGNDA